jgi:hypothetical protein
MVISWMIVDLFVCEWTELVSNNFTKFMSGP